MLYGALPGTETLKLSVPHQNPGGASPAGSRWMALAVPALVSTSARPAARASQVRFIMPPVDSRPLYETMCDHDGFRGLRYGRIRLGTGRPRAGRVPGSCRM